MKLERRNTKQNFGAFSGKVEVAINGLDEKGKRLLGGYRRSFRVSQTTVEEVFDIVEQAIIQRTDKA